MNTSMSTSGVRVAKPRGVFEQASKVFKGWTDGETGARVLKIEPKNRKFGVGELHVLYHQYNGLIDGGTRVLLRDGNLYSGGGAPNTYVLDLTTGELTEPFPKGYMVMEVAPETNMALLKRAGATGEVAVLWDMKTGKEVASVPNDDNWRVTGVTRVTGGNAMVVGHAKGKNYSESVRSKGWLVKAGGVPRLLYDVTDWFCNHFQPSPVDGNVISYNKWPSPIKPVPQVIHVMGLDGSFDFPARLDEKAFKPPTMYGARDHYVWTPDGKRIVSYYNPDMITTEEVYSPSFDHFKIRWVLSALDWKTGEDFAAEYPKGRWGRHMQVSCDSKYIISAGGNGFDKLYVVDIQKLKDGWNERVICGYPKTVSQGNNVEPFPQPAMLPDASGILFNAGWPGPEHGVYMVEWNG